MNICNKFDDIYWILYPDAKRIQASLLSEFSIKVEEYNFAWGQNQYLKCFVKSVSYKLTMFLADGTPVRAIVDMSLEEVDTTQL